MRKSLRTLAALFVTAALGAALAMAQTASSPFTASQYYASSFNLWSLPASSGGQPNNFVWPGRTVCNSAGQNLNFFVFSTTQPVLIQDANSANSEVVTPSAITSTSGSCGFTAAPSNTHYSFYVKSGTAGLQEAVNQLKDQSAWPAIIVLDRNWFATANTIPGTSASSILGAATGDGTVLLEDITQSPAVYYKWNGSAFSSTTSTWTNAAPTAAAGTAAGTSPTIAIGAGSTALIGTVNLTAGTSTTTGTLFTLTYAATGSGGFGYTATGSCTVTSIGSNSFTAFTVASSGGSTRVATVTATSAPTASTAYKFAYNCK